MDLRADNVGSGTWTNFGTLGNFTAVGSPTLNTNVGGTGIPGVAFSGFSDAFQGPNSVSDIDGASDRSIEVWAYNPSLADEEAMVSWGHRGVTRRNLAFNFGANSAWGAASHFNDDMAWSPVPSANAWHHLVYTYSNSTATIYADGAVRAVRLLGGPLDTFTNEPINLGCQRETANGTRVVFYSGYLNTVRVHGGVLTPDQVARNYSLGPVALPSTTTPPPPPNTNTYPAGLTITLNDVGQAPWNVSNFGKIPENYQPGELLGSGILNHWLNVGGYTGGPDHTTGTGFSAFELNGGLSPSIVLFNQHVVVRSLFVDTFSGQGTHIYVRGYTYSNSPVPVITVDVPTRSHPQGRGYGCGPLGPLASP